MIIKESRYTDVFAIQLKTEEYLMVVLPSEGGKIASFKRVGCEKEYLLQNESERYLKTDLNSDYVKGECCGFDDMFPTIDPVTVNTCKGLINYPDHGEVCRVSFESQIGENELVLKYKSPLGYEYLKTFTEKDGKIFINYSIKNVTDYNLDVLWAGHCLINATLGGQVNVEFKEGEQVDVMFDLVGNFKPLERVGYKKEYLKSQWEQGVKSCNKFYFVPDSKEGFIEYRYTEGDTFVMEFDCKTLPCVGIWQNFGNINDDYCIGLEPCTIGYDTVENAEKYGKKSLIGPQQTLKFFICLYVK